MIAHSLKEKSFFLFLIKLHSFERFLVHQKWMIHTVTLQNINVEERYEPKPGGALGIYFRGVLQIFKFFLRHK